MRHGLPVVGTGNEACFNSNNFIRSKLNLGFGVLLVRTVESLSVFFRQLTSQKISSFAKVSCHLRETNESDAPYT